MLKTTIPILSLGALMTLRFIIAYAHRRHTSSLLLACVALAPCVLRSSAPSGESVPYSGSSMVGVDSMRKRIASLLL